MHVSEGTVVRTAKKRMHLRPRSIFRSLRRGNQQEALDNLYVICASFAAMGATSLASKNGVGALISEAQSRVEGVAKLAVTEGPEAALSAYVGLVSWYPEAEKVALQIIHGDDDDGSNGGFGSDCPEATYEVTHSFISQFFSL